MKIRDLVAAVAVVGLSALSAVALRGWQAERQRANALQAQMATLNKQEQRSAVMRSVSKQLEEIALQQKIISDERREEAIQQKRTAELMRQQSEVERMKALVAQEKAQTSEHHAQEALQTAESERQIAEHQRIKAEMAKRVTDTLSYQALSRSLGSLALIQSQRGNSELADLLAYASYHYNDRYGGDIYHPAIFQSLLTASESMRIWPKHRGAVMAMAFMPHQDNVIVTVSTYGEIMLHEKRGEQLVTRRLLTDSQYDFRDVYIDAQSVIYAISRSGHLAVVHSDGTSKVIAVNLLDMPQWLSMIDGDNILIVGDHGLAQYNRQRGVVSTRELDFRITAASRYGNLPVIFDDKGRQHVVENITELVTSEVPVKGRITAFASSKNTRQAAFGLIDGTIYLLNEQSGDVTRLEGHLSRISKLKFNGRRLFSASYDGMLNLWNTASDKIEPMTLLRAGNWIMNFTFDATKNNAWIGTYNGDVSEALMSVPTMAGIVRDKLKRNFTVDEWNYYIGKNVSYERFTDRQQ